jgi:hypothetical protein
MPLRRVLVGVADPQDAGLRRTGGRRSQATAWSRSCARSRPHSWRGMLPRPAGGDRAHHLGKLEPNRMIEPARKARAGVLDSTAPYARPGWGVGNRLLAVCPSPVLLTPRPPGRECSFGVQRAEHTRRPCERRGHSPQRRGGKGTGPPDLPSRRPRRSGSSPRRASGAGDRCWSRPRCRVPPPTTTASGSGLSVSRHAVAGSSPSSRWPGAWPGSSMRCSATGPRTDPHGSAPRRARRPWRRSPVMSARRCGLQNSPGSMGG